MRCYRLRIWREPPGRFETYTVDGVSADASFLEMLDRLNEDLTLAGGDPVAFDSDCREGICGACGFMIDGAAHGPLPATTVCQLHMRHFPDGATLTLEPFRSAAFPVLRDLVLDRSALDRIIAAGGYVSVGAGAAPDAHAVPVPKQDADRAFAAAACIGCGACVAACPSSSAMLFTGSKVAHLGALPQGKPERFTRVRSMVEAHDDEGFAPCSNLGACASACPKEIGLDVIAALNCDMLLAPLRSGAASRAR